MASQPDRVHLELHVLFRIFDINERQMNTSELKLEIFRQVDLLDKSRIEEVYGILLNFINKGTKVDEWAGLTAAQKQGIINAVKQVEEGKGIAHDKVIGQFQKKYSSA